MQIISNKICYKHITNLKQTIIQGNATYLKLNNIARILLISNKQYAKDITYLKRYCKDTTYLQQTIFQRCNLSQQNNIART